MLYAIISQDKPGSLERRLQARPAHLARLEALQSDARLILAGTRAATGRVASTTPGRDGPRCFGCA